MINKKQLETLKELPFEHKEALFNKIAEQLEKAKKDPERAKVLRIEKSLSRILVKTWHTRSTKSLKTALRTVPNNSKRFTKKDGEKFIKALEQAFGGVEKKTSKRVKNDVKEIYKLNKIRFGKQFKLDSKQKVLIYKGVHFDPLHKQLIEHNKVVQSFDWDIVKKSKRRTENIFKQVTFGEVDALAFDGLASLENIAIGDHFPSALKPRVSKLIQENVLTKGLNHADASNLLRQRVTEIVGGNLTGALPASVATGEASVTAYFKMLTATNTTFASNFSRTNLMVEARITRAIFDAILDNLTSVICDQMNGRVFTVEQMVTHQNNVLAADDVDALQGVAPFMRNLKDFGVNKSGVKLEDISFNELLAKAGVIMPPLHGHCRSEINPF